MKSLKNKIRDSRKRMGVQAEKLFRPLLTRTGVRLRLALRIRLLNSRASRNPRRTFALVFSALLLIFLADLSLMLLHPVKQAPERLEIASIDTVFSGFRTIQGNKEIHRKRLSDLALAGNSLRHSLDSLLALPEKTREDSLEIRMSYLRLERIVNTLKASE